MTTHIIENNIVVNTIVATLEEAQVAYPDAICLDADQHPGGIGWTWDGEQLVPPPAPPAPVPQSCTRRQGRLALLQNDLLDDVEDAIAAIPDPAQRRAAQIEYEADTWDRGNAFLQGMWQQLGGSEEGLDDLFRLAVTL